MADPSRRTTLTPTQAPLPEQTSDTTMPMVVEDTLEEVLALLLRSEDLSALMHQLEPQLRNVCPSLARVSFYQARHGYGSTTPTLTRVRSEHSHSFDGARTQAFGSGISYLPMDEAMLLSTSSPVYIAKTIDLRSAAPCSLFYVPVRLREDAEQAWGVLEWMARRPYAFNAVAQDLLTLLQPVMALALLRDQQRSPQTDDIQQMQVLVAAHQALRVVDTPLEVLAQTLESALQQTGVHSGKIYLYDDGSSQLMLRAQRHKHEHRLEPLPELAEASKQSNEDMRVHARYAQQVFQRNSVQHWRRERPESANLPAEALTNHMQELWGLPLHDNRGASLGVLLVVAEADSCSAHDIAFLEVLSEVCGEALLRQELLVTAEQRARDYRRLYHNAERRSRELSLLERVRSAVSLALSPADVFKSVVDTIVATFGYSAVMVYTMQPDGKHMVIRYHYGYNREGQQPIALNQHVPVTVGIVGRVMREGKATLIRNPENDPDYFPRLSGIVSQMIVPFQYQGDLRGLFCIESSDHHFDGQDLELLIAVAEHVTIALERAQLYSRLQDSEAQFRAIFEQNSQYMSLLNTQGRIVDSNNAAIRMFKRLSGGKDVSPNKALQMAAGQRQYREVRSYVARAIKGQATSYETSIFDAENNELDLEVHISPILDSHQRVQTVLVVAQDLSALHRYSRELERSESRFRLLAEHMSDLVILHDAEGNFLYVSPSCRELLGYSPEWMLRQQPYSLIHPNDMERFINSDELHLPAAGQHITYMPYRVRRADGRYIWFETHVRLIANEQGKTRQFVSTSRDVSSRQAIEEELRLSAHYDGLTGLPNRLKLLEELESAMGQGSSQAPQPFSLLFIDLDRFKVINDSLGHTVGDDLLRAIAQRLQNCVDIHNTVARLGGDEFAILLLGQDVEQATYTARAILDVMSHPFNLRGREVYSGCSIGIAGSHARYQKAEDLLRDADLTMYQIKQRGGGGYTVFDRTLHQAALRRLKLETDMRRALGTEQFTVMYQPIIDLRAGNVVGFEALTRWKHGELGPISPHEFITMAEETGLILDLGEWLMEQVCAQISAWEGRYSHQLTVGINVSAKQFTLSDVVAQTKRVISIYGILPQQIKLEITESALLEDSHAIIQSLSALRALGIRIHIDDFGTGYSSLAYLQRLPIDALKIDRSFVMDIEKSKEGETNKQLVRTIIAMAQGLGIEVIAEGVETLAQARYLDAVGAHYGQGFYFSRPLTAADSERLLQRENSKGKVILPLG